MRLRSFTARTMPDAMALVRQQLGADAVILSTQRGGAGVVVTAALDEIDEPTADMLAGEPQQDPIEILHETLAAHGTPARLVDKLLAAAAELAALPPIDALAGSLEKTLNFAPLVLRRGAKALIMVGPPGAGKTVVTAKLATRAVLAGRAVRVISSDTVRAGGIAQLEAFTRLLGIALHRAESEHEMERLTLAATPDEIVLIDSGGINPYSASDRRELADLIAAARAEPIFVLPAGGDVFDTIEMAQAFRLLGAARLLVTRLDMVHRLGSVLGAAEDSGPGFCGAGTASDVAKGLTPLNPVALARLLLPEMAKAGAQPTPERANS
jgi:flagellar biosynthesis protein FlhF